MNKTWVVILTKKRIPNSAVRGRVILVTEQLAKYVDVLIDMKVILFHEIRHKADNVAMVLIALRRLIDPYPAIIAC